MFLSAYRFQTCCNIVVWGTVVQAGISRIRFPMRSLDFSSSRNLSSCTMASNRNEYQESYLFTYGAEPFLRSCQFYSLSRTPQHFMEPEGSNTVFTRAIHWSLSWAMSIQSTPSHPIYLRSILILPTHLRLVLPSGLFPSSFSTNILYVFLFSPIRTTSPAISSYLTRSF
jgi:hypothetical protein